MQLSMTVPAAAHATPPHSFNIAAASKEGKIPMTVKKLTRTPEIAQLMKLFGRPPVLSNENAEAYYAVLQHMLDSRPVKDFVVRMYCKDIADCSWEMIRYSRHKVLVVDLEILEQQDEADEEAGETEQVEEPAQESGQADEPGEEDAPVNQDKQPTEAAVPTQFDRWLALESNVDTLVTDCDEVIAGPQRDFNAMQALQNCIDYYERLDRLYNLALARREKLCEQLDLYCQGLGSHLRRVSDEVVKNKASEAQQGAPSITGPEEYPQ